MQELWLLLSIVTLNVWNKHINVLFILQVMRRALHQLGLVYAQVVVNKGDSTTADGLVNTHLSLLLSPRFLKKGKGVL